MQPLRTEDIRGTWGTLILPINEDDSIDMARLEIEIDALLSSGVRGIYSNGSTGELHNQSDIEYDHVNELLAGHCERANMAFQIGASHMDPRLSLKRAECAAKLNPGAIQVILPDWIPCSDAEAHDFLSCVIKQVSTIPLILYLPGHAKRSFTPDSLGRLLEKLPGVAGIKTLGGNAQWYASIRHYRPDLSIFVPGHELATASTLGANGSYSNVACLSPSGAVWWEQMMDDDPVAALELERRIQKFMTDHIVPFRDTRGHNNTALDKLLAAIGNWAPVGTKLRWPYHGVDAQHAEQLRDTARADLPELFLAETSQELISPNSSSEHPS
ncbi:MAG: dihydrodipicolinate synthase family protein [Phycisphaeraceae bacterium]